MPASYVPPIDHETEVLACLAEILDLDPDAVDPGRRLTELGLDSFAAVRLRRRLLEDFGVDLPLTAFLDAATPATVAVAVAASMTAAPPRPEAPATAVTGDAPSNEDGEPFPLTAIQTAYLVGRDPSFPLGGVATHFYFEYDRRPGGDPHADLARLGEGWDRVVARHPMLRVVIDDEARQRVLPEVPAYRIPVTDLRDAPDPDRRLAAMRADLSHRVHPVERWPLFDIRAALLPDGRTRLFVGMDIIALDMAGWMRVMREWGRFTADPQLCLPPPATTFARLLEGRAHDPAESARRDRDRAYWAGRAGTLPPGPALPWTADAATRGVPRFTRHAGELSAPRWARLRGQAAARGLSPTAVLLASLAAVLGRWGAAAPFCLNTTLFDRPHDDPDALAVVGDFTTTVLTEAAPLDVSGAEGFDRYAAALNRRFWSDLEHRSVSAVEILRGHGDLTPAYPVVFTSGVGLADESEPPTAWLGTEVFGISQTPQILIDHIVWEDGDRLRVAWDVVDGALPDGFAAGLRDAHLRLLHRLADEEHAWTDPALGWDPSFRPDEPLEVTPFGDCGPLIDGPGRAAADRHPGGVALVYRDDTVSHGALRHRAARTAAALAGLGLGPGDMVAVAAPKGAAQIAATLGVTASGAGYVPVEPNWPAARIASVCAQAGIRHALALDVPDGSWPDNVRVHALDADGVPAGLTAAASPAPARPDELAYAIFTSGSTGRPKGVAVEHRQARTTLDDLADRCPLTPDDRVLALSALSFDLSVYDVFGVLGAGGAMVLPDPGRQRDPGHWLDLMGRHRVTVWNTAPALLEMLVEYAEIDPEAAAEALASLRLVLLSGDWIPVTLPDRVRALAPKAELLSLGGATEASIWSICYPIGTVDPAWPSIPYGRALRGQSFHILDADGHPCPAGEPGELYIGGDGVARGYLGDPEQTAQRFSTHPVLRRRVYRTGDLGRWRYDGTIEFLGRVDRQVKIRGHRIELGEIESVLSRAPGVRQCVARAVPGPDGGARLVAYVAAGDGAAVTDESLAGRLRAHLPEYMVPSRFVRLAHLPVTANGKVDYDRLGNPFRDGVRPAPAPPTNAAPQGVNATPQDAEAAPQAGDAAAPDDRPTAGLIPGRPAAVPEEGLTALLVDAARAGLEVRISVGGGRLDPIAALRAATELAVAARTADGAYEVIPELDGGSLLGLRIAARPLPDVEPVTPARPGAEPVVTAAPRADAPDAATERAVRDVFGELLTVPIDVTTPFFDLGATSLTLVRAHRRLVARLDVPLVMVDLFAHPTVRDLARLIDARRTAAHPAPAAVAAVSTAPPAATGRAAGRRSARAAAARATR
ncbi:MULTISPECIES: non-ribosomal peptide synthetase [Catenuloplanes]|uniref:Phenyloxazoline synthase MbtB n=1 Tax=Catenuloplanes niger TaxID=587534 RepID=A0AAE3ZWR2_9ACTN|nr:amino acid adenylation domain-containing protein [Catenuloplanes niger]MDR7327484.1 amino acid adenylation domain-containing protein [Catenuloplanes niger]